jgi:hypothetical protein
MIFEMKRMLQWIGCALVMGLATAANAQDEHRNINNQFGPPNYTGGTVASPNETYASYTREMVMARKTALQTVQINQVYPNPAATYTRIFLNGNTTEPVTVSIINYNGVMVQSFSYPAGSGRFDIDVSSLPDGLYALQVQEQGKEPQSIQLSKSR